MKYADAKEFLSTDGSWRDVYILGTKPNDLERFLDFVRPILKIDSFTVDGEPSDLLTSYAQVLKQRDQSSPLLSIPVGRSYLNCHFFTDAEIELDLIPAKYDNESDWNELDAFLRSLADTMRMEVVVTPENSSGEVLIRYTPRAEQVVDDQSPTRCGVDA